MEKDKLHRLDNYDALHTVSNHTRGFSDKGRSTVQFPIDDMAPDLDGHRVPSAEETALVKERLRQVAPRSADIFESFGGDYAAMTKMPIDEGCRHIIAVVEERLTKVPMEWLTPDGSVQAGRLPTTVSMF
ncbi:unnamed protein product [Vitrella brassicaformis CCMP3155]|uniref:Uncharacterized protein n=1 Tax=Vitrella brassicaformis (strain CCMP3155) TaxID=1169540 RepID=A0A0G4END9_VITBC|nr:unnamed protein product [Vitrella brassicaformis CCMP3155]|mmetsp:Transcript_27907/g.80342  ORF Transcript_27907/g.80342 Transcript_27907/m.80342 type:complete len:130 (+) Transcript_27907:144-533(+)|eukprot:CEL98346.1 unnamed protein product [Vitrella brassicaformis CCMP3155]